MNRIPALGHKRTSTLRPFAPGGGRRSRGARHRPPQDTPLPLAPPPVRTGANRRNVNRCQEAVKCWRGGQRAFTHVALLSQLHLSFSPFPLICSLFFFFLGLSSSFLSPSVHLPFTLLFFSLHEGAWWWVCHCLPCILFLLQQVVLWGAGVTGLGLLAGWHSNWLNVWNTFYLCST